MNKDVVLEAARNLNKNSQVRMSWERIQKETNLKEAVIKQALTELHSVGVLGFDGRMFWFE